MKLETLLRRFRLRPSAFRLLVGVTGIEPVTSSLSGTRSNQLSYTPGTPFGLACQAVADERSLRGCPPSPDQIGLRRGSLRPSRLPSRRLVEATGFEPVAPSLQSSCSTN